MRYRAVLTLFVFGLIIGIGLLGCEATKIHAAALLHYSRRH